MARRPEGQEAREFAFAIGEVLNEDGALAAEQSPGFAPVLPDWPLRVVQRRRA
jgi:hypothetical protein